MYLKKQKLTATSLVLVFLLIATMSGQALSQAQHKTIHSEFLKLNLGAYFPQFDTEVAAGAQGFPDPLAFNLEDILGFDDHLASFRLDGWLRFKQKHRLLFAYYEMERTSQAILSSDIVLRCDASVCGSDQNVTIGAGTGVSAQIDWDSYVIGYGYSFIQTDKFETDFRFGTNITYMSLSVTGALNASVNGTPTVINGTAKSSITAPLPWLGLGFNYQPFPRWKVGGSIAGIYANIDIYEGYFLDINAYVEYLLFDNVGLGIGYNLVNANLEIDDDNWNGEVDYWYSGVRGYVTIEF